jgi:hypothetical protein
LWSLVITVAVVVVVVSMSSIQASTSATLAFVSDKNAT